MQSVRMPVYVLRSRGMKLHQPILVIPELILRVRHFFPSRRTGSFPIRRMDRNVFPGQTIRREDNKNPSWFGRWQSKGPCWIIIW